MNTSFSFSACLVERWSACHLLVL